MVTIKLALIYRLIIQKQEKLEIPFRQPIYHTSQGGELSQKEGELVGKGFRVGLKGGELAVGRVVLIPYRSLKKHLKDYFIISLYCTKFHNNQQASETIISLGYILDHYSQTNVARCVYRVR